MKRFEIGDLVTAPKRNHKYDVTKEYEFATVTGFIKDGLTTFIQVYLQETGSYKDFSREELKLVHRNQQH